MYFYHETRKVTFTKLSPIPRCEIALFIFSLLMIVVASCEQLELDCIVSCECESSVTYCANLGFNTWPYHPQHSFKDITILDLSGNKIDHLPTVDIRFNSPRLEIIDLRQTGFPCHAVHYLEKSATVLSDCGEQLSFNQVIPCIFYSSIAFTFSSRLECHR